MWEYQNESLCIQLETNLWVEGKTYISCNTERAFGFLYLEAISGYCFHITFNVAAHNYVRVIECYY
jgi:hypothetical protein